ncbi:MAG: hypothetical protein MPJ25_10390 [Pirellulales bacterium]|nr:hypothetical protein [Pirellulales bacterium]
MSWIQRAGLKLGINYVNKNYINPYFGMKRKKKFGQTTVGKILGGALGLINPALGGIVKGEADVADLIQNIKNSQIPTEDKVRAQELVLEAYEAEVEDRASARAREARVAASGGGDWLFKFVGWGITITFMCVVAASIFGWVPEDQQRLFDMAFGAVVAAFTQVIGYFFGSSLGSKQKNHLLDASEKQYQ